MSQNRKDGGPAFPSTWTNESDRNGFAPNGQVVEPWGSIDLPGMSLRDWFAGQVSIGYLSAHADPDCSLPKPEVIATWAYKVADAMIVERSQAEGQ